MGLRGARCWGRRVSLPFSGSHFFPFYFLWPQVGSASAARGVCQGALRQGTGKERPKACGRSHSRGCSWGTESKPEAFRASKKNPRQLWPRVPHVTCSSRVFSSRHLLGSCRGRGAAAWGMPRCGAVGPWGLPPPGAAPGVLGCARSRRPLPVEPHGAAGCFLSESELSFWGRAETSRAVKEKRARCSPPRHSEQE